MFKVFFGYPFVLLVCLWLASDVEVSTSLKEFKQSRLLLQFPKASFRPNQSEPWFELDWRAAEPLKVNRPEEDK